MKIPFKLNGKKIEVPAEWGDLTYNQYMAILKMDSNDDYRKVISICLDVPLDMLLKSKFENLESLMQFLNFTRTPAILDPQPERISNYIIPKDITFESLAQFEDMRKVMQDHQSPEGTPTQQIIIRAAEAYPYYAAIYCQRERDGEYDLNKAMGMVDEMRRANCLEILSAGNFFLIKLINSFSTIKTISPKQAQHLKRNKPALQTFIKRLGSILR